MAKLLGLDKVATFFRIIRDNGGIFGSVKTLFRTDDLKTGTLIGEDKYGNRYYENNMYFVGRNRWVIYADKVGLNYDASQVPAEWFGWLHYKTDLPPHKDPFRPKYKWMLDHQQNMSGTNQAYMPYSTTRPKIEPWQPPQ
ncbi:probable NADH dehydrogenase [ubiquinone] 1 alpha subcomplex subunit 12 [Cataglyphis hispanica]|uniref:probable NADH dehydrogenase [ubiquinone] 1 alpha subcomplex subunit 12 n=1 Tax=Cataglyphis hispanica TaxID=1086592 RepID=UPI00217F64D1|nr:probable NADH dehydrogenase [ubiquinone] 1 alpha subcomplex subunit 12 [Cataglyphis hispanica]XP_050464801.1 probable NADH dehydrogenase [ubiquinone] 1 alpha subcomplex subunit 12 [Cataglyphis hispanica]